jgi:hypothetical protein
LAVQQKNNDEYGHGKNSWDGGQMRQLLSGVLAWWALLHLSWMVITFLLWGVINISDENPLTVISESIYDVYAFGVFRMQWWLILGFAPLCWLLNFIVTGSPRILPWKRIQQSAD